MILSALQNVDERFRKEESENSKSKVQIHTLTGLCFKKCNKQGINDELLVNDLLVIKCLY